MKTKRLVQFTILISLILVPSLEVESFHDPFNTVAFPQFVAGQVGDLYYSPVMRVCSPGGFQGQFAVFRNDRSIPTSLLINELPYQGPVPIFLGAEECLRIKIGTARTKVLFDPFAGFAVVERLELLQVPREGIRTTGSGAALSDLAFSFFYNIRDSQDNLVDSVAVPPSPAGRGFRFVTSRGGGFDVGVAAFVTVPNSIVNITVHLPEQDSGSSVVQGDNTLTGTVQILGQRAFFLHEVITGFPETVSAALVPK